MNEIKSINFLLVTNYLAVDFSALKSPGTKPPMKAKYSVLLTGDPVIAHPLVQPQKYQ